MNAHARKQKRRNTTTRPRHARHATPRTGTTRSPRQCRGGAVCGLRVDPSRLTRASSGEPGGRRHGPPPPTATVPPAHHPLTHASQPPTTYVATHAHCPSTHAPEPTNSSATSSTARMPAAPAHAANGNARRPPPAVRRSARTCVAGTRRRNCLPAAARPPTPHDPPLGGPPSSQTPAGGAGSHRDPWRRAPPAVRRPQQRIPRCAPRTHVRASPARGGGAPTHPLQAWLGPSSDIVVCAARPATASDGCSNNERTNAPSAVRRSAAIAARRARTHERHRRHDPRLLAWPIVGQRRMLQHAARASQATATSAANAARRPQERSHRCAPRTHAPPQLPAATAAAQSPPSAAVTTSAMSSLHPAYIHPRPPRRSSSRLGQ